MLDPCYISGIIRGDFQAVLKFKWDGGELEVVTPFAMANRDVVSVFVKQAGIVFVCRVALDMGRLRPRQKRARQELLQRQGIRQRSKTTYEKAVFSPQCIGSAIVDLAEFAVACSWLFGVKPGDETWEGWRP